MWMTGIIEDEFIIIENISNKNNKKGIEIEIKGEIVKEIKAQV